MSALDLVRPGEHLVIAAATPDLELRLREALLTAGGVAYAGRRFRVYPSMRVRDTVRFYGAIHAQWDGVRLAADLADLRLGAEFEVRRMKRTYQRALVLALAAATAPALLVVEGAEEFDDPATGAYLVRACARAPRSLVTMATPDGAATGDEVMLAPAGLGTVFGADAFEERMRGRALV